MATAGNHQTTSGSGNSTSESSQLRQVVVPAIIAAVSALVVMTFNYFMTERVRTELSTDALNVEKSKVAIALRGQETAEKNLELALRVATEFKESEERRLKIQENNSRTEEVHLTSELTKIASDLNPRLTFNCQPAAAANSKEAWFSCQFKNEGTFRVNYNLETVWVVDRQSGRLLSGRVVSWDKSVYSLSSSSTGSANYRISFSDSGFDRERVTLIVDFLAKTEPSNVELVRRLAKGILSDQELVTASSQNFRLSGL